MKYPGIILIIFFIGACNTPPANDAPKATDTTSKIITNDTIPKLRQTISAKPVASFSKKVPDELNDWHFAVSVYETKQTFHYLMKMQYMELAATDTLKIPNFGIQPKVELRAGKDPYSCIIGFLDKDKKFREYKLVSAKDDRLKVTILHRYAVSTYEDKY